MVFDKAKCIELLNYKIVAEKKHGKSLFEYDAEKDWELADQLTYIKDYLIWKQSFPIYYELCKNFKFELIDGEFFVTEVFNVVRENDKFLESFVFSAENIRKLDINPKSFNFRVFIYDLSTESRMLETDPDQKMEGEITEDKLRSYIIKSFPRLERFNDVTEFKDLTEQISDLLISNERFLQVKSSQENQKIRKAFLILSKMQESVNKLDKLGNIEKLKLGANLEKLSQFIERIDFINQDSDLKIELENILTLKFKAELKEELKEELRTELRQEFKK